MIVSQPQYRLAKELCDRIGLIPTPAFRAIGLYSEGEPVAFVGYDGWNGASCMMHVAIDQPKKLTRGFIQAAFDYPFNIAGCSMVLGLVPSGNVKALEFDKRLGFEQVCRLEGAHPDGALVLLSLRRDQCKWLRKHHGQKVEQSATCA